MDTNKIDKKERLEKHILNLISQPIREYQEDNKESIIVIAVHLNYKKPFGHSYIKNIQIISTPCHSI